MTIGANFDTLPEGGIRNIYSRCPFKIEVLDGDRLLGNATAFFVENDDEWFIITNGHVVTGRHAFTRQRLGDGSPDGYPRRLRLHLPVHVELGEHDGYQPTRLSYDLYADGQPRWYVHPSLGHRCDVVALEARFYKEQKVPWHPAINRISDDRVPVMPGVPVFILGYPKGISVKLGMPIWKSGYVASEPRFPITIEQDSEAAQQQGLLDGLPAFFVDSQTRPGMSGSPIVAQYTGTWNRNDPYGTPTPDEGLQGNLGNLVRGETRSEFIGCYSGRVQSRELDAGLGICWRKDVIDTICAARLLAAHPHTESAAGGDN
ncbi:S1 family peptidase [Candidatus Poriferisodalis sp.]|uniref:S1 family peptidase n=1 Tax=Candidatus Poriferisodalis sp. TaxID=3101277 RepID=UPI003AF506A0